MTLPGETAQLKERSRARVVNIHSLPPTLEPSLRSAYIERRGSQGVFHRAEIEIAFPIENVGPNLPVLLATLAGNLFELGKSLVCACLTWICRWTMRLNFRDPHSASKAPAAWRAFMAGQ